MCGINGLVSDKLNPSAKQAVIRKMNDTLAHRGPDSAGVWDNGTIYLGHRRLSVIDLNSASDQPFLSADGKFAIVYNGELYNYRELRLELQRAAQGSGHSPYFFRTASDTEVILAAYIRWGSKCLDYFNGMFAFAIFDIEQSSLFIARDRLGVKPLYYHYGEEGFIFSSEIRPIIHSGIKTFVLNKDVIGEYVMYQTVHAPETIIKGIKMLMPGYYIEYKNQTPSITQYYNLNNISNEPSELSYKATCDKINELLAHSVQRRLISDVPFGAFLSGGIDSSAVVGLMSRVSTQKVQTFNISFDESEFSESQYARLIAKKFNTEHHEIVLSPQDFLKQLPEALSAMDHPGGDGPNTYIVSKATRAAGITVALSGIGGDELFAGYDIFRRMSELKGKAWLNYAPLALRNSLAAIIKTGKKSVSRNKIAELLSQKDINFNSAYLLSRSLFTRKELSGLIKNTDPYKELGNIIRSVPQIKDHLLSAVSVAEMRTYMLNVLLRDTDQMSMASALEVREPFLDHKLVDFVLGVGDAFKFPVTPKKLLCDSLGDLLPPEIINRPKMGFTLPWQYWLKNELAAFCEININQLAGYEFCESKGVINLWKRFLSGDPRVPWSRVWHLVVLNNWLNENKVAVN